MQKFYRAVAQVDAYGKFHFTETNAYSGNNGRAAILNNSNGANFSTRPATPATAAIRSPTASLSARARRSWTPELSRKSRRRPGLPTPVGKLQRHAAWATQRDKIGKDTNFRGLTIFNNVLYFTKGSGGNGVNTVYFVDPTLTVCNDNHGIGVPAAGATLPTAPLALRSHAASNQGS